MSEFRELRRKDRAINSSEATEILQRSDFGVLCTCDGIYPYAVPVNYVYKNGVIYVHSASQGHKIENIKKNSRVSFVVVGGCEILPQEFSTRYESVIVFGKAEILEGKDAVEPLREIAQKYSPQNTERAEKVIEQYLRDVCVIKIEIEHLQGKARR
ncbi:MAG: pyridoxamine 5'-phosphate oxidase family protein [Pseudothermotoga sp.]